MRRGSMFAFGAGGILAFAVTRARRGARVMPLRRSGAHVVILGGGFGGLAAAAALVHAAGPQVRVSLVDRHNYHLFTPMLYQVATCGVVPYDVAIPLRPFAAPRGIHFRKAAVEAIDLERQVVRCDTGDLGYDFLIIALGSTTDYFGNAGAQRYALPLKALEGGIAVRNRVIDTLERAALTSDAGQRQRLLTFAIIGGGATGVETAGALADALHHLMPKNYPTLRDVDARVVVIEAGSKLLGHMNDAMADLALQQLRAAGVDVWLRTKVTGVGPDRVDTEDGRALDTGTVIWATGVHAPDVVSSMSAGHGKHGRVIVNECLQLPDHPNVFAIGDNAEVPGSVVPLLAAAAMQEGRSAASSIVRLLLGERPNPFRYADLGSVVSVGHRAGVAHIGGRVIGGFAGWLAWRVVHLARITNFRNKLATALDWTTGYFYDVDTARLDVEPPSRVA